MQNHIYFNFMNGYRIRCNHWKPGSYWQRLKTNDKPIFVRCTDGIQYPLEFNDLSVRYIMSDNWEMITPTNYDGLGRPYYNQESL